MKEKVVLINKISKVYRLGEVGTGTISHDLNRWWSKIRGKEDPFAKVGVSNIRTEAAAKNEYVYSLRDVSFEVEKGDVIGVIGRNGAGKSTLLKIISRITSPTGGEIKIKGRIASLLEVGTGFYPELTGREKVYMNGTFFGMTKKEIDNKFDEIMDFAGCLKYADTPVKRYSSGMKVRLGFAVAAFLEPEILIVDEVLAVGDAEFQRKAIGKMQDISNTSNRTVIFVSHNMASIESLCNKVVILNEGKVEFIGDTNEGIRRYIEFNQDVVRDVSLKDRKDRKGGDVFRFSEIQFFNEGQLISPESLGSGKKTSIKVFFETKLPEDSVIDISIGFLSIRGVHLAACRSGVLSQQLKLSENKNFFICDFDRFPLKGGSYYLNVAVYYKNEMIDFVEKATFINVLPGDYYGTGKIPANNVEGVLVDYKWQ